MTLDQHLSAIYRAEVKHTSSGGFGLGGFGVPATPEGKLKALREEISANPALRTEAIAKLASLQAVLAVRKDYATEKAASYLNKVLSQ